MNAQIYQATPEQVYDLLGIQRFDWIEVSKPLLVGMYKDRCECVLGIITTSLLSDSAYIWLWTPPEVTKIIFARHAKRILSILLSLHSTLFCTCINAHSARWLRSLGATESSPTTFTFRRL